jgi:hypothetical protein
MNLYQTVSHTYKIYFYLFLALCELLREKYKRGKHCERNKITHIKRHNTIRALLRSKVFGWLIIKERYHSFINSLHLMNINYIMS